MGAGLVLPRDAAEIRSGELVMNQQSGHNTSAAPVHRQRTRKSSVPREAVNVLV